MKILSCFLNTQDKAIFYYKVKHCFSTFPVSYIYRIPAFFSNLSTRSSNVFTSPNLFTCFKIACKTCPSSEKFRSLAANPLYIVSNPLSIFCPISLNPRPTIPAKCSVVIFFALAIYLAYKNNRVCQRIKKRRTPLSKNPARFGLIGRCLLKLENHATFAFLRSSSSTASHFRKKERPLSPRDVGLSQIAIFWISARYSQAPRTKVSSGIKKSVCRSSFIIFVWPQIGILTIVPRVSSLTLSIISSMGRKTFGRRTTGQR